MGKYWTAWVEEDVPPVVEVVAGPEAAGLEPVEADEHAAATRARINSVAMRKAAAMLPLGAP